MIVVFEDNACSGWPSISQHSLEVTTVAPSPETSSPLFSSLTHVNSWMVYFDVHDFWAAFSNLLVLQMPSGLQLSLSSFMDFTQFRSLVLLPDAYAPVCVIWFIQTSKILETAFEQLCISSGTPPLKAVTILIFFRIVQIYKHNGKTSSMYPFK